MDKLLEVANKLKSNDKIKSMSCLAKYLCLPKGIKCLLEESLKRKEEEKWKKEFANLNGKEPHTELLGLQSAEDIPADSTQLLKGLTDALIVEKKSNTKNTNYRWNKNLKKA